MGVKWIKVSVIYFLMGVGFGLYMHLTVQLQWGATHAHINVVGWLTTVAIGAIYSIYPTAGDSTLGKAHFWMYNLGLPILFLGMMFIYMGVAPILIHLFVWAGGLALALSVILFIINVFTNVNSLKTEN